MDSSTQSFLREAGLLACVFCQSTDAAYCVPGTSPGKVLKCLHLACKQCAVEHVSGDNTILCCRCKRTTPDPGRGHNVVESLADWPATVASAAAVGTELAQNVLSNETAAASDCSPGLCQDSDCNDFVASSKCVDCDLLLCEGHAGAHTRSKRYGHHKVCALTGTSSDNSDCRGGGGGGGGGMCGLHHGQRLVKFCPTCQVLLCVKCSSNSSHTSHDLCDAAMVAEELKSQHEEEMKAAAGESADAHSQLPLPERLSAVEKQIEMLKSDGEAVSEKISTDFEKLRTALQKREEKLKAEVDHLHWERLEVLQKKKNELIELHGRQKMVDFLVKSSDDVSVVRVSSSAKEVVSKVRTCVSKEMEVVSLDTLYRSSADKLAMEIGTFGEIISDNTAAPAETNPISNQLGAPAADTRTAEEDDPDDVLEDVPVESGSSVLRPNDSGPPSAAPSMEILAEASYMQPMASSSSGPQHNDPGPPSAAPSTEILAEASASTPAICNQFNDQRKADGIQLSNGNRLATACKEEEIVKLPDSLFNWHLWPAVCGHGEFQTGTVHFRVQLLHHAESTYIGVSTPSDSLALRKNLTAWPGREANCRFTVGGKLGWPWKKKDIIALTLDCGQHRLTAVHERSGDRETIPVPPGPLCFKVYLYAGGSVRILEA